MSWEEDYRHRYPCPCGKGESEAIGYSDDWGRSETRYEMLCPDCKDRYVYDKTPIHGHPGDFIERGWVLKSVLEAEDQYRKDVTARARELYYEKWRSCFDGSKSKKDIWRILTLNGKYYPSLGTFYQHNKGFTLEQVIYRIDTYFNYHYLKRVIEICGVEPDLEYLGVNEEDKQMFRLERRAKEHE